MSGSLFTTPRFRPVSSSGDPLSGAKLWFYQAGTATPAGTYTTSALSTPHANPVIADAGGQFPAIYLDPAFTYKAVLQTAAGIQIWSEDGIPAGTASSGGGTGTTGDSGLSVAELRIYLRAEDDPGTPTGGSFDFGSQTLTPPTGWEVSVPAGSSPVWVSSAVAAVEGVTGTDSILAWSAPVIMAADGSSVDIVFKRSATMPATPAPSPATPVGWYTDVDSVPASSDKLWSSVGTRDNASLNWIWQLPIQVEGDQGPAGTDATLYYIKALSGTAIKNGSGTLTLEAHQLSGGNDILLSSGTVKLYVGTTEVTVANGYATGSTGYIGVFDSGDITGSTVVTMKASPSGTVLDSITLVDVIDGSTGGVGADGVYGYVEPDGALAWVRGSDQTTWLPSATTLQMDCTFVQGGVDVARVAWVITRDSDGILTGAAGTHTSGDLNGSRVTVTEIGSGTQVYTAKFGYSYSGDICVVAETALTSLAGGEGATGATGPTGPGTLVISVDKPVIPVMAYQNGLTASTLPIGGQATVWEGDSDVTATATFSAVASGCTGTVNTATDTPVTGQPIGYYEITAVTSDTATLTLTATVGAVSVDYVVTVSRNYVGYEIVASLPVTNLFTGRMVFLSSDNKLYRYTSSGAWTREVDGADLKANSITTNSVATGAITAAKITTTSLSALSANLGTVTAGILQSSSGGYRCDASNARVIFNTAPGTTGGYVRVQGVGFGPGNVYLDWYGPKPAGQITDSGIIGALSDATAIYYLKTDGSAVNGSRLRGELEVKCWGKWKEVSGVVTMLDRFNVAGMTYVANGRLRVDFATALPNENYCVLVTASNGVTSTDQPLIGAPYAVTTDYFYLKTIGTGGNTNAAEAGSFMVIGSNVAGGSLATTPTSSGTGGGTIYFGNIP